MVLRAGVTGNRSTACLPRRGRRPPRHDTGWIKSRCLGRRPSSRPARESDPASAEGNPLAAPERRQSGRRRWLDLPRAGGPFTAEQYDLDHAALAVPLGLSGLRVSFPSGSARTTTTARPVPRLHAWRPQQVVAVPRRLGRLVGSRGEVGSWWSSRLGPARTGGREGAGNRCAICHAPCVASGAARRPGRADGRSGMATILLLTAALLAVTSAVCMVWIRVAAAGHRHSWNLAEHNRPERPRRAQG
jgi:hypothetical protein